MHRLSLAFLAVLAVATLGAGPAGATAGMICTALDKSGAFVEMNLSRFPGTPPNWVTVSIAGKEFTTKGAEKGEIGLSIRQSFDDGRLFAIDLSETLADDPAVKLRILVAEDGDNPPVYIGYLQVVGLGVYPISCTEDE